MKIFSLLFLFITSVTVGQIKVKMRDVSFVLPVVYTPISQEAYTANRIAHKIPHYYNNQYEEHKAEGAGSSKKLIIGLGMLLAVYLIKVL